MNNVVKCFLPPDSMRDSLQEVLQDEKIQNPNEKFAFWLLATALSQFFESEKSLPLSGKLPDMTSTTEFYITL